MLTSVPDRLTKELKKENLWKLYIFFLYFKNIDYTNCKIYYIKLFISFQDTR
jgi:hypothetical protein